VLIRLLIRRGSVLKAKLRMAKWSLIGHVPWQKCSFNLYISIKTLSLYLNAPLNKPFKIGNKKRNKYKCLYKEERTYY
jgi:hypothetical protein